MTSVTTSPPQGGTAPNAPMRRRPSRASLIIGAVIVSVTLVVMALVVVEVVFRFMRPAPKVGSLILSSELGWDRFPPINPQVPATAASPAPPIRIACMGDSFTHNTAWTQQLIEELNRRGIAATGWEVGVSGYGQVQEAMKLERVLPELKPDITVLLFYGWNDPRDNCATPGIVYNPDMLGRPYLSEDGARFDQPSAWGMTLRDSELFRRMVEWWWFKTSIDESNAALRAGGADAVASSGRRLIALYSNPKTWLPLYQPSAQDGAYVTRAWRETERAMQRIVDLCAAQGSALVVAGIDSPITIDRDVFDEHVAKDPAYRVDDFDPDLPVRRFEALARSLGIPHTDPVPALRAYAAAQGRKIYDPPEGNLAGHLLPDAQRVMASVIADEVERLVRSDPRFRERVGSSPRSP